MNLRICSAAAVAACLLVSGPARAAETIAPRAPQFVALSVADAARSAAWYQKAFGLRVIGDFKPPGTQDHVIILGSDALLLEILQVHAAKSPGAAAVQKPYLMHGHFKVGFHVEDLEAAVALLKAQGAQFETGIIDDARHHLRFALLRDPDGNYVQLFGTPRTAASP
jgi:glyoxylase I family protein